MGSGFAKLYTSVMKELSQISKTQVCERGGTQCVLLSTNKGYECAFGVRVDVDKAFVILKDNSCAGQKIRVDINVNVGMEGDWSFDVKHEGKAIRHKNIVNKVFNITYGVPGVRLSRLAVRRELISENERILVALFNTQDESPRGILMAAVLVWYCTVEGKFKRRIMGPSRYSSLNEMHDHLHDFVKDYASHSSTTSALINNTGPIYGDFNGSILNIFKDMIISGDDLRHLFRK
ncbi:hypothetical protein RJT34_14114 [Clitoria ternatea]|uniref:Uncharacterized protein n=1 Tax=Clitoria ternatea TaxID=43366 RepID=A0AAN9PMV9_CLITE